MVKLNKGSNSTAAVVAIHVVKKGLLVHLFQVDTTFSFQTDGVGFMVLLLLLMSVKRDDNNMMHHASWPRAEEAEDPPSKPASLQRKAYYVPYNIIYLIWHARAHRIPKFKKKSVTVHSAVSVSTGR